MNSPTILGGVSTSVNVSCQRAFISLNENNLRRSGVRKVDAEDFSSGKLLCHLNGPSKVVNVSTESNWDVSHQQPDPDPISSME